MLFLLNEQIANTHVSHVRQEAHRFLFTMKKHRLNVGCCHHLILRIVPLHGSEGAALVTAVLCLDRQSRTEFFCFSAHKVLRRPLIDVVAMLLWTLLCKLCCAIQEQANCLYSVHDVLFISLASLWIFPFQRPCYMSWPTEMKGPSGGHNIIYPAWPGSGRFKVPRMTATGSDLKETHGEGLESMTMEAGKQ